MAEALQPDAAVLLEENKEKVDDPDVSLGTYEKQGDSKILKSDEADWPLLLKNYDRLNVRPVQDWPLPFGCPPLKRPIAEYVKRGFINVDKPINISPYEVTSRIKRILKINKAAHSGMLEHIMTGCLIVCLDQATRVVKTQQNANKEYFAVFSLHSAVENVQKVTEALEKLRGVLYQRTPRIPDVNQELRECTVYDSKLLHINEELNMGTLWVSCQAECYVRIMCEHLGLMLGVGGHMIELRRVRSGIIGEEEGMVTMHDILDAHRVYKYLRDETFLRRVIQPMEYLLTGHKRIFIPDSVVSAICFGTRLLLPGILRYENGIKIGQEIVIVTTKGEAVALAIALMTTRTMASREHGEAAKITTIIMERNMYPRTWIIGRPSLHLKPLNELETLRELDEFGKPNEKTPSKWLNSYTDKATNVGANDDEVGKKETASAAKVDEPNSSVEAKSGKEEEKTKRESKEAVIEVGSGDVNPTNDADDVKLKQD